MGRWQGSSLNRFHFLDGISRSIVSGRVSRQEHGIGKVPPTLMLSIPSSATRGLLIRQPPVAAGFVRRQSGVLVPVSGGLIGLRYRY